MSLADKTLFVTGTSRGIGLAIAKRAAKEDANVANTASMCVPGKAEDPRSVWTAVNALRPRTVLNTAALAGSETVPVHAAGDAVAEPRCIAERAARGAVMRPNNAPNDVRGDPAWQRKEPSRVIERHCDGAWSSPAPRPVVRPDPEPTFGRCGRPDTWIRCRTPA